MIYSVTKMTGQIEVLLNKKNCTLLIFKIFNILKHYVLHLKNN